MDNFFDLDDYSSNSDIKITEITSKQSNDLTFKKNTKKEKPTPKNSINHISNNLNENPQKSEYAIQDNIDISLYKNIPNPKIITFPFELDTFQKRSIIRIENNENLLVCAHTSSGKTLVAEYAIAKSLQNSKKVIYTSPIKALSNQKFREFKKKFENIGIITGDVNINSQGQCLIMTTEILLSMLYKKSDLLNLVGTVIFDEVHYINDNERGHIWEEILILLPSYIQIIMLSATIPNNVEFANWVGKIKKTKVYMENTEKRVIPLQHQIFIDEKNIFQVKSKNDTIYDHRIKEAIKYIKEKNINYSKKNKNKNEDKKENIFQKEKILEMVNYLKNNNLCPAILFLFNIRKIKEFSKFLSKSLINLITNDEKNRINQFLNKIISLIPDNEKNNSQITEIKELLQYGIGIHHSGLLPLLKETIEILFSHGLIKILLATTSFGLGLNMPTKTVVFTNIYKFNDEGKNTMLCSSEYQQMCGRAGRRGVDTIGQVFLMIWHIPNKKEEELISNMLIDKGNNLESKFRICYGTLLSFLYRNIKNFVDFYCESFQRSHMINIKPEKKNEIDKLNCLIKENMFKCKNYFVGSDIEDIPPMEKLLDNMKKYDIIKKNIFDSLNIYNYLNNNPGIIFKIKKISSNNKYYPVMLINIIPQNNSDKKKFSKAWCLAIKSFNDKYEIDKDNTDENSFFDENQINLNKSSGEYKGYRFYYKVYEMSVIEEIFESPRININNIEKITIKKEDNLYFKYNSDFLTILQNLFFISKGYFDCNGKKLVPLNYEKIIGNEINEPKIFEQREKLLLEINKSPCIMCENMNKHMKIYNDVINKSKNKIQQIKKELIEKTSFAYKEFQKRINILKELEYIDNDDNDIIYKNNKSILSENELNNDFLLQNNNLTLTKKGIASLEIISNDSILISEILLSDIFSDNDDNISFSEKFSFLSAFVLNQRVKVTQFFKKIKNKEISTNFEILKNKFYKILQNILDFENKHELSENLYNRTYNFDFCKPVYLWLKGETFSDICTKNEIEEGRLHNVIMRMFLFCDEIINFYDKLGNTRLIEQFKELKNKLLHGIMEVQSLYLQDSINIDEV